MKKLKMTENLEEKDQLLKKSPDLELSEVKPLINAEV